LPSDRARRTQNGDAFHALPILQAFHVFAHASKQVGSVVCAPGRRGRWHANTCLAASARPSRRISFHYGVAQ
jgi:hypothetical protein